MKQEEGRLRQRRSVVDAGETYSVLTSDVERFDAKEFESLLSGFSFGVYRKHIE